MEKIAFLLFFIVASAGFVPEASFAREDIILEQDNSIAQNQQETVHISFFYGEGCPHCAKAAQFLEKMSKEYGNLEFKIFEIYNHTANAQLMGLVGQNLGINISGVPFILIGEETVYGYLNDETTGKRIENIIKSQSIKGSRDVIGGIISEREEAENRKETRKSEQENKDDLSLISLPVLGEIDPEKWSLPVLTIVIAAIDGFNPCAMWVLLFLISLLLGMEDKRKMWSLGTTFIAASGVVYFLFLSAWLNLFLFLGFITAVRVAIGIVAIVSGGFHLKEWWTNKEGACKVTNMGFRRKIMEKLRLITCQRFFVLALAGIILLAFAVNLVELVCSAGLPAIYTSILSMSDLPVFKYYLLLLLYILVFMFDDLLIFVIAMTTLQATGISTKYSRWSNLIGGIIIFLLGIFLIFKPGWIMFG